MKHLFYAFFILLAAQHASALIESVSYACEDQCLSGTKITWNVTLENKGEQQISVSRIEIRNRDSGGLLAENSINATVFKKLSVELSGTAPKTKNASAISYEVCITTLLPQESRLYEDIYYGIESTFCDLKNRSFYAVACRNDSDCASKETCNNSGCTAISCGECGYAEGHSCRRHECCSNESCGIGQFCANNICTPLNCSPLEYFSNHSCIPLSCGENEIILNHSCTPLICSDAEIPKNGKCEKISCADNEAMANRTCIPLACAGSEIAQNHSCQKLQCTSNERAQQHRCIRITCLPHQSLKDRQCVPDRQKIYGFLELPLMGMLLAASIIIARNVHAKLEQRRKKSEEIYSQTEKLLKK